ncbi:putative membrane protein [Kitasatospora gansuensis]|uniref:Putative membrane protein n=1 Tax=Kitasatospora gansuensis TaxID=258050 RepID=A0A7W7SFX4_9ACTN|nr:DUF2269 family protein [Kitasatospora gansuensis]MBB4949719.1 putative membrane protein [Kitasatospora gansuensis]
MAKLLLSLHVLASVLFIGPVAVAVSMFPRRARAALTESTGGAEQLQAAATRLLHRITQVYALLGLAVPLLGVGTAQAMDVMGDPWLITSIVLTAVAAALMLLFVVPGQQATIDSLDAPGNAEERTRADKGLRLLPMTAGVFNLLWAVVVVLMVIRPGSTTGA